MERKFSFLDEQAASRILIAMFSDEEIVAVLCSFTAMEEKGFNFVTTGAAASYNLCLASRIQSIKKPFSVISRRVIDEEVDGVTISEATIKICVDNQTEIFVANGNGPVNALDTCFRKGLLYFFPEEEWLAEIKLHDYSVTDLSEKDGSAARIRVRIVFSWYERQWVTIGCHENIITASRQAIEDGYRYPFLLKQLNK